MKAFFGDLILPACGLPVTSVKQLSAGWSPGAALESLSDHISSHDPGAGDIRSNHLLLMPKSPQAAGHGPLVRPAGGTAVTLILSHQAFLVAAVFEPRKGPLLGAADLGMLARAAEGEAWGSREVALAGCGISSPFVLFRFLLCLLLKGPC